MIRSVLSVIVGLVVAFAIMIAMEFANSRVYPGFAELAATRNREAAEQAHKEAPNGAADQQEVWRRQREAVREVLADAPLGALLVVLIGNALGSLGGGFTAARLSRSSPLRQGVVLGLLLTLAGIGNNLMLPPPAWFWVATLLVYLPGACIGATIGTRPNPAS